MDQIRSDGTRTGTRLLRNINRSTEGNSYPSNLAVAGADLYFTAIDEEHTRGLWTSDGTSASRVSTIPVFPHHFAHLDGVVYFAAFT